MKQMMQKRNINSCGSWISSSSDIMKFAIVQIDSTDSWTNMRVIQKVLFFIPSAYTVAAKLFNHSPTSSFSWSSLIYWFPNKTFFSLENESQLGPNPGYRVDNQKVPLKTVAAISSSSRQNVVICYRQKHNAFRQ